MAGWLAKRLGNGLFGLIDADNPLLPPAITASIDTTGLALDTSLQSDRPSQKTGRVYKDGVVSGATSGQTVYTVTSGKKLYVTSIEVSVFNSSTTAAGLLNVRDNTTVKSSVSIPQAGVAALAAFVQGSGITYIFPEPKQFSTNLNIAIGAGTLTYSVSFTGYEE